MRRLRRFTVRQQLDDIDTTILAVFSATILSAEKETRLIMLVEEPSWLKSIAIQMGRHLVFLPPFEGGENLFEDLATENALGNQLHSKMSGTLVPWPHGPQHSLDFTNPQLPNVLND